MAHKGIPKWKQYRELRKRVNEHVSICNTEQCQGDEDLSLSSESDGNDNEMAGTGLYGEPSASVGCASVMQEIAQYSCEDTATSTFEINDVIDIDDGWQRTIENVSDSELDERNNLVSSSESETDGSDETENLVFSLATWVTKFGVSHSAVNELLRILQPIHLFLPKDARTLLKTVKVYDIDNIAGGSYYHFGISNNINTIISSFP